MMWVVSCPFKKQPLAVGLFLHPPVIVLKAGVSYQKKMQYKCFVIAHYPRKNDYHQKLIVNVWEDAKKDDLSTFGVIKSNTDNMENNMEVPKENIEIAYDPAIFVLGHIPRER